MFYGEGVVMRLLPQDSTLRGLVELKMAKREDTLFHACWASRMDYPGHRPTGSGKTTTLYAALSEINDTARKIITLKTPWNIICAVLIRSRSWKSRADFCTRLALDSAA